MQKMGKEILMVNKDFFIVVLAAILVAILPASLLASVAGPCVTCHTMHNSQDDLTQAFAGDGSANWATQQWNGATNTLVGPSAVTTPQANLLKTDCVGCHTASGSTPYIALGGDNFVPIVWNTGSYPGQPLAGGNFFNVATDDSYGHNVFGIGTSGIDDVHDANGIAPGGDTGIGCADSCHRSLALASSADTIFGAEAYGYNGCRGCHLVAGRNGGAHHNQNDTSYRMLQGHLSDLLPGADEIVVGVEDTSSGGNPGWEATATGRNTYLNHDYTGDLAQITVGRFCSGCHKNFHAMGQDGMMMEQATGGGDTDFLPLNTPWIRHPNDVDIPQTYEYSQLMGQPYNKNIPVGQDATSANVTFGDTVICLSCHRAHASNYPDALRWDYTNVLQEAHSQAGSSSTYGCFYCHRSKDDIIP